MPTFRTPDEIANPEIVDAELHPDSRLRYIQRRMQEEEGVRLTIDNIAYILKLNGDYGEEQGG
ncbi:MAG TPA: hypothetical protein VGD10_01425 [Allosphingosinicella sp.]|uniref:hypothetical protein n=1 Tax=Allosphingosinicella sp. TaxID=2823234 RepID=UPI002ED99BA2